MNKTALFIVAVIILIGGGIWIWTSAPKNTNNGGQNQDNQTQQTNSENFYIQGMKVEILKQGTGEQAKPGDTVNVNYTGTLQEGTKFDSNVDPSFNHVKPFSFTLGQNRVIQGWELGVAGMKVGEKRKLTIPPELGYGSQGAGGSIPPNATLIFEVDLLGIK